MAFTWTSQNARRTRNATCRLLEGAKDGIYDWEQLARNCLMYMSEDEVADMARINGYFDGMDDEENDE